MYKNRGSVGKLEIIHKVPIKGLKLPARWVIWARVGEHDRVWLGIVQDDGDQEPLRTRSLVIREFFSGLIGGDLEYGYQELPYGGEWSRSMCHGVDPEIGLPEQYRLRVYSKILEWFRQNCPERLGSDFEALRQKARERRAANQHRSLKAP